MEDEIDIEEFKVFLEITDDMYSDEQLNKFLKTCVNSLFIMHEQQGRNMAKKTLIELKNYL
tara:strand:+ start:604 stop:786 length:183 start_codon:yes stop_codon:yes gene_type:complete